MAAQFSTKDLASGGLFVVAGAYFALEALTYEVGTPFRMGPGFMPLVLGTVLAALGLGVAASGWHRPDSEVPLSPSWRGMALIVGVIIFFAATIRGLGFIPVVLLSSFVAALSSRLNSPVFALLLAITLTVMCTLIFVVGLGMSVPWFGPWLGL